MIYLYDGGGAQITEIGGPAMAPDGWLQLRTSAGRLLRARGKAFAAQLLERTDFELLQSTNFFNDDFTILRRVATIEEYVSLGEVEGDAAKKLSFKQIADTITELGTFVRFIVAVLQDDPSPLPVAPPSPQITTRAIEAALADAELLLRAHGPAQAMDRIHTALHGFLRAAVERAGPGNYAAASVTELFKVLRTRQVLTEIGDRSAEAKRVLLSLASIVDAANTIRNNASGAHPSSETLEEPEAMLTINAVRTIIHYLDRRLEPGASES